MRNPVIEQLMDSGAGWTRSYLSESFAFGASLLARKAQEVERRPHGPAHEFEHRSFVLGAITSSVSFLEAAINETFEDAASEYPEFTRTLSEIQRRALQEGWRDLERNRIAEKYQMALTLLRQERFDRGASPFQDFALLVKLRNSLVHSIPKKRPHRKQATDREFEAPLRSKFEPNPFAHENEAFFPERCLGAGCAIWAVNASLDFCDSFRQRTGVKMAFKRIEPHMPHRAPQGAART